MAGMRTVQGSTAQKAGVVLLEAPGEAALAAEWGAARAEGRFPSPGRGGARSVARARSRSPSWALVERSTPAISFGGGSSRSFSAPRASSPFVRPSPGPGSYVGLDGGSGYSALSYIPRVPSALVPRAADAAAGAVIGSTQGGWQPTAASLAAWRASDSSGALDRLRRRAPSAVIGTEGLQGVASASIEVNRQSLEEYDLAEVRFTLVEPRVRGVLPMIRPPLVTIVDEDENGESNGDDAAAGEQLPDPGRAVDEFMKARKPAWSFTVSDRWPVDATAGGLAGGRAGTGGLLLSRPPEPLNPNYDFVRPRIACIPRFATFLNLR